MWESTLKDFHDEAIKQESTFHMSGMMSPVMREELRMEIKSRIDFMWEMKQINANSSPYDVIKNIYETDPVLQDWNVAPLRDEGQSLNLLYPSKKFKSFFIRIFFVKLISNFFYNTNFYHQQIYRKMVFQKLIYDI